MQRRTFVRSAGIVAATGLAAVGSTTATEEKGATAEELGLIEKLNELYRQGKIEEAEELLQQNNVRHSSSSDATFEEPVAENPRFSTDTLGGKRPKDECTFYQSVINESDDDWLVTGVVTLRDNTGYARTSHFIDDACGITYDSSEWSSVDATQDNVTLYSNRDDSSSVGIEFDQYPAEKGVSATVENVNTSTQDSLDHTINIQTTLTRVDSGNDDIPVYFNYEHNWANTWAASIDGISFSIPYISVDTGVFGATAWSAKLSAKPGEYVNE